MSVDYCTVADVKLFCQINYEQLDFASDAAYETWIEDTLIPKSMDMVDRYCHHNFQDNTKGTIYVDGRNRETVHVTSAGVVTQWPDAYPEFPIGLMPIPLMEVQSISIDGVAQTLTNFFTYNTHIAYENGVFCEGRQNVVIVARFGYGTIPHDIQYVTAQLCTHAIADMVRMRKMSDLVTPVLEGGGNLNMLFRSPSVLTKNEKEILNKYRYHAAEIT